VLDYIWKAAWCLHAAGDPAAEDWVAVKALAVMAGDSDRAAAEVTAQADAAGLTGTQRAGADACVRYLTSKHDYLRYDQALAAKQDLDMPNARRDACRTIVSMRLAFGVSLDEAEEALHDVESRWRAALEGRDLFGAYVNAVDATYPVLQRIFTSQDLAEGMRSAAYWNLLQMADMQANRGGIFAGTVQALRVMRVGTLEPSRAALQALASEITTQIEALERAETELQALRDLASRNTVRATWRTRRPPPFGTWSGCSRTMSQASR
jgi:hypothetical protein